jgi:hypothetical protein
MEVIDLLASEVFTLTPSVLSVILLWKLRSLEVEVQRLHELLLRHLEHHANYD